MSVKCSMCPMTVTEDHAFVPPLAVLLLRTTGCRYAQIQPEKAAVCDLCAKKEKKDRLNPLTATVARLKLLQDGERQHAAQLDRLGRITVGELLEYKANQRRTARRERNMKYFEDAGIYRKNKRRNTQLLNLAVGTPVFSQ